MFNNPSIVTRIAIGKLIGLLVGLLAFVVSPLFIPEIGLRLKIGIVLWYTTFGAIIGVFGIFTTHPVLKLPMPWWFRAPLIGAWLNFVLSFFCYEIMENLLTEMFGAESFMTSPYWFAAEGAIIGLLIGYFATRFGGEGKETLTQ